MQGVVTWPNSRVGRGPCCFHVFRMDCKCLVTPFNTEVSFRSHKEGAVLQESLSHLQVSHVTTGVLGPLSLSAGMGSLCSGLLGPLGVTWSLPVLDIPAPRTGKTRNLGGKRNNK